MLVAAFAVILITVLLQGTTLGALIRTLGITEDERSSANVSASRAEAAMMDAQRRTVEGLAHDAQGNVVHPQLLERYTRRASMAEKYAVNESEHKDRINAHYDVILAAVAAGRSELMRLHRAGDIDDETLHALEYDLDIEEIGALDGRV
jgi:CPA1 family monovalent cation:H+ antiporter